MAEYALGVGTGIAHLWPMKPGRFAWCLVFAAVACPATACSAAVPDPEPEPMEVQEGTASYYSRALNGRRTASGVPFDNDAMVAAHPIYSFGTIVRVTNLENNKSVTVRIVDRGPARGARRKGVIIDVSRAAAKALGFIQDGRTRVRLEVLGRPRQRAWYNPPRSGRPETWIARADARSLLRRWPPSSSA